MKIFAAALAVLLLPFATGCSDATGITKPSTDRITIAPSTSAATLDAGESSTINIVVTRPVGYDGPITLDANNFPTGVTGTFSPTVLAAGETVSALILSADANAPDGVGNVTVRASGADVTAETATISVAVGNATPEVGAFSISVIPGSVSISKGGSTSALVAIERTGGYIGAVSLSITNPGGGITADLSPASTSGNSASINISADNSAAGGTYTATITASGDGSVAPQSSSISVTIIPSIRN